ncbi:type ISP restriction/modification enzyme [Thiospirillum jenense]|uniref:site-specific DNA-methyltransferase (adenine-specific) n=1 Tax=Thiospirillum jenense TaxID=1653858 RepID=A0A839HDH6_9GAMM|nr:type ISP restriction/modification enzyme [Thiospirillum jenense]MBB1125237.1 N-6 DNA methylase [Thiospirillum jenense]
MHNAIQQYQRKLDDLYRVAGADNEGSLRKAFEQLLETLGHEQQLILVNEYEIKTAAGNTIRVDGALVDRIRLVHGYWEAKDAKDDLDKEITAKFAKGYPRDNIIFEDTRTAVLFQNGLAVMRCPTDDGKRLEQLLTKFFNYELPAVADFRQARQQFMIELPGVAAALRELLAQAYQELDLFRQQADSFLKTCRRSIGAQVTASDVDEMLIQHLLTDQIFAAVFTNAIFHRENHLAQALVKLENTFLRGDTRQQLLKRLEPYFAAIRRTAANAITSYEKQEFLKQVYEDFYTAYNPKQADKLGIVYTPREVVRFIIEGCDWLAQQHFNKSLADPELDILDPCMGTGTFVIDLIDYLRGDKQALKRKFAGEIHANEIAILPYYIGCLNIEQTYYEATDQWCEFTGACFVNTLANWQMGLIQHGEVNDLLGSITEENHRRTMTQKQRVIPVIMGNPPYNANQKNANDNNQNMIEKTADARIKETYLAASTAQKTKLYDPFVRFLRWASDRIGEYGIVAFISNSSFISARSFDGFRQVVAQEFQEIWVIDLKGNARTSGELRRCEGGNVFDDKIRVGVAIYFCVRQKNPDLHQSCRIHYLAVADYYSALGKRRWLNQHSLRTLERAGEFRRIKPTAKGEWLNQPTADWSHWIAVASKDGKAGKSDEVIFQLFSFGVATNRDEWVYGLSEETVAQKVQYLIRYYEAKRSDVNAHDGGIKWTRALKNALVSDVPCRYDPSYLSSALYRPFVKRVLYFNAQLNEMLYKQQNIFPLQTANLAIAINGVTNSTRFETIGIRYLPDLHYCGDTITLPLWTYLSDGTQHDNITDWSLNHFQQHYHDATINKRAIFDYVYAVLHDPRYRQQFALNLKSEFPRIPTHPEFWAWSRIGGELVQLHTEFETVPPWPLKRIEYDSKTAPKCRLKANKTDGTIEIDSATVLTDIPASAWDYQLGTRSALEWVLDQYKERTPKDSTIREQFNTYQFADYKEQVIELLARVCRVSVATVNAMEQLTQLTW